MSKIVLFGVGSSLSVDYEETCRRLGWTVSLGVKNVDAEVKCSDHVSIRLPEDLSDAERRLPFAVPLFTPRNRMLAFDHAEKLGFANPATLIDPTVVVASTSQVGPGVFVNAATVIGAACEISGNVTINRGCSIGHHSRLGEFVSIAPGCTTCGNVTIKRGTLLGAGSIVLPSVTIGENAIIGAGTVVTKDVPPNTKVIPRVQTYARTLTDYRP